MIKSTHPDFEALILGQAVPASAELLDFLGAIGVDHSVENGEVVLDEQLEFLDTSLLSAVRERLPSELSPALSLEIHRVVGSTNDIVMQRLAEPEDTAYICTAEMQTAGKGRRGRHWVSPFGRNVYLSLGWFFQREISELGGLSQIAGIQVVDALRAAGIVNAGLKWPNDVLLDGGKLGGILVELRPPEPRGVGVVVGVGINLFLGEKDVKGIDQPWQAVSSLSVSRRRLLVDLIARLILSFDDFDRNGFERFASVWDTYNCYQGKQIKIIRGDEEFVGIDSGIDELGNLRLKTSEGEQRHYSGEVSMRPVDTL